MFSIWKGSTTVLVLQLISGVLAFLVFENGTAAVSATFAIAMGIALVRFFGGTNGFVSAETASMTPAAACAAAAGVMSTIPAWLIGIFLAVMMTYVAAALWAEEKAEPWPLLFVSALPVLGPFVGGTILVWRWMETRLPEID